MKTQALLKLSATIAAIAAIGLAPLVAGADDERGKQLYALCAQCHGDNGEGSSLALAPSIAGMGEWYLNSQLKMFKSGARGTHPGDIPGMRMLAMSRWLASDEDIAAVSSYVSSLPASTPAPELEGGDASKGAALYAVCGACHGAKGEGNQQMNAPRLVHMNDWYLRSQIERFKAGIRGGNPKNTNAVMMRGMALSLADDQAVRDVIAHIMTLSN